MHYGLYQCICLILEAFLKISQISWEEKKKKNKTPRPSLLDQGSKLSAEISAELEGVWLLEKLMDWRAA